MNWIGTFSRTLLRNFSLVTLKSLLERILQHSAEFLHGIFSRTFSKKNIFGVHIQKICIMSFVFLFKLLVVSLQMFECSIIISINLTEISVIDEL